MSKHPGVICCSGGSEVTLEPGFFKALCDPRRVAILARLVQCGRSCTVSEIGACCPTDLSVVSRHLALLRAAGILESKREGKQVRYSVRYGSIVQTLRSIADAIEQCCPSETCHDSRCDA